MNEEKQQLAYRQGGNLALGDVTFYIKHLNRQAVHPANISKRKEAEKKGFFDTLGLVDDEHDSSLVRAGHKAWVKSKMEQYHEQMIRSHKGADDTEYVQTEITKYWKQAHPELIPHIDQYWIDLDE